MTMERFEELRDSKCETDAKGHHHWEKLGVAKSSTGWLLLIWRCSQCKKIIKEPLEEL